MMSTDQAIQVVTVFAYILFAGAFGFFIWMTYDLLSRIVRWFKTSSTDRATKL